MPGFRSLLKLLALLVVANSVEGQQCKGSVTITKSEHLDFYKECSEFEGELVFEPNFKKAIIFPKLQKVSGKLYFRGDNIETVELPALTYAEEINFSNTKQLGTFKISKLNRVDTLYFDKAGKNLCLDLSPVEYINEFTIWDSDFSKLEGLEFREINSIGFRSISSLKELTFSNLQVVNKNFVLSKLEQTRLHLPKLTKILGSGSFVNINEFQLDKLNYVGDLDISFTNFQKLNLMNLAKVENNLVIFENNELESINLPNLKEVNRDFFIRGMKRFKVLKIPKLHKVGNKFTIIGMYIRNLNFNESITGNFIDVYAIVNCSEIKKLNFNKQECGLYRIKWDIDNKNLDLKINNQSHASKSQINKSPDEFSTSNTHVIIPSIAGILILLLFFTE